MIFCAACDRPACWPHTKLTAGGVTRGGVGPSPPMPKNPHVSQMKLVGPGKQEGWEGTVLSLITLMNVDSGTVWGLVHPASLNRTHCIQ